jgi:hypothetical protein
VPSQPVRVLLEVVEVLDRLGIPYFVVGSFASSILGEPRTTLDIDFAVRLRPDLVGPMVSALASGFHLDLEAAHAAVARQGSFHAIHHDSVLKVDFFVLGGSPLDDAQMRRRQAIAPVEGTDPQVFVTSAEDLVLRKLAWFRDGGSAPDRHWRDVLGVLKVQRPRLELGYLRRQAGELGLSELLERALDEAGVTALS